jgi:hypothetical protein
MTTKKRPTFEPIDSYERLIKLRAESPDKFLLQTSEATRRTIHYYEAAKAKHDRRNQ